MEQLVYDRWKGTPEWVYSQFHVQREKIQFVLKYMGGGMGISHKLLKIILSFFITYDYYHM